MSLKSSIAIGLVAGIAVHAAIIWKWTSTKEFEELKLENEESQAVLGFYSGQDKRASEGKFRGLMADWTHLQGPESAHVLKCWTGLAYSYQDQQKYAEAVAEYRSLVEVMDRVLGPDDWHTIWARKEFANVLDTEKRYPEAEKQWRILLQLEEGVKDRSSMATIGPREQLIQSLQPQDKFEEIVVLLKRDLEILAPVAAEQRAHFGEGPLPKPPSHSMRPTPTDYREEEAVLLKRIALAEKQQAVKRRWEEARGKLGQDHDDTKALAKQLQDLKDSKL